MSDGEWIIVRNWGRFQHYSDREPVWIKVYLELRDSDEWSDLSWAQRGLLVSIWMEFGASRGVLRASSVSQRCRQRARKDTIDSLVRAGFIQLSASKPLALARSREQTEDVDVEVDVKAETAARLSTATPQRLPADLVDQVTHLNGADERTIAVLTQFVRKGLPEAAFRNALEATRQAHTNRRLRGSEVAYFVGTLRQLANSGQYQ